MKNIILRLFLIIFLHPSSGFLLQADEIGTAFGVTLGKPFPETISSTAVITNGAIIIHNFKPTNVKYIESVATASFVTEKTNYVCSITGFGNFESKLEQEEAVEILRDVISKKYTTPGSRKKESVLQKKFSIEQGSRSVTIEKQTDLSNFPRAYRFSINYGDELLARKILDSQKQLKLKETKSEVF